jgi:flavin reductase (DIM6/NTAB) family NADH-FMN oxidoreductase RutF
MERTRVEPNYQVSHTLTRFRHPGLLLVSTKPSGESNVMTIGWGAIGPVWGRPVFLVMVRPSRYTYEFVEASGVFTVNVPSEALYSWVGVCGSRSGRELDKFAAYDVATSPAQTIPSITIDACPLVYECRVLYHSDLIPAHLEPEIEARSYGGSNYHRLYYGEILGTFAAE